MRSGSINKNTDQNIYHCKNASPKLAFYGKAHAINGTRTALITGISDLSDVIVVAAIRGSHESRLNPEDTAERL